MRDLQVRINDAKKLCEARGLRLTPLREQVLSLIIQHGKPIKAYDLLERLDSTSGTAAPPTVYRTLDFLLTNGFVHKLESMNAFVSCGHDADHHQGHFLICDQCSITLEINDPDLTSMISDIASARGFSKMRETVEVHGLCERCSSEQV